MPTLGGDASNAWFSWQETTNQGMSLGRAVVVRLLSVWARQLKPEWLWRSSDTAVCPDRARGSGGQ